MFSDEKLSQAGQKRTKYWHKICYIKHILRFWIWKTLRKFNYLLQLSIKIRAGKVYAYRILLSFKTSVTSNFFNFRQDNCVRCETVFLRHNSVFCRTFSMSETNFHASSKMEHFCKAPHFTCLRECWLCFLTLIFRVVCTYIGIKFLSRSYSAGFS